MEILKTFSGANNRVPERQQDRPSSAASSRNREEQEYLEKLRQIRQQNYQERKMILGKNNPELEAEERKKKAEALKVIFTFIKPSYAFNPFPNKPWFLSMCSISLLKTLCEK